MVLSNYIAQVKRNNVVAMIKVRSKENTKKYIIQHQKKL